MPWCQCCNYWAAVERATSSTAHSQTSQTVRRHRMLLNVVRTCCLRMCWVRREPPVAPTRPPTPSCPGRLAPASGRFVFAALSRSSSSCGVF